MSVKHEQIINGGGGASYILDDDKSFEFSLPPLWDDSFDGDPTGLPQFMSKVLLFRDTMNPGEFPNGTEVWISKNANKPTCDASNPGPFYYLQLGWPRAQSWSNDIDQPLRYQINGPGASNMGTSFQTHMGEIYDAPLIFNQTGRTWANDNIYSVTWPTNCYTYFHYQSHLRQSSFNRVEINCNSLSVWRYYWDTGTGAPAGMGAGASARASAGSATSILSRPASTSVTAPSAPAPQTFPTTTGGSIFLAHSAANPAPSETDMIPQPSDFLSGGTKSSVPTNPFTFTGVTNNALNTIYYFLMDAAQNISFQDKLSFYNDQDAPVITPNIPSTAAPYTEIWLGPNKPHLNGSIEINDNPMGGETSTVWDVSMRRPPPLQPGQSYNTDKGADPSYTGYTESTDGAIRHMYGIGSVQMNDVGDEVIAMGFMTNSGLLVYQYTGTGWHIATGETTQGLYDSVWGGNVTNAMFSKGSSDYIVYQTAYSGRCLVYKKVGGSWPSNAVWVSPQLHASSSFPAAAASCPLDTSTGMDRFVCMSLTNQTDAHFTVYKKDSGDSWSIEETLGPVPYGSGFSGIKMTDDGSRVITTGEHGGTIGQHGKIYVWTRSGTTWTRQADTPAPTPIPSGFGSSVNAGTVNYADQLSQPMSMGRGGFDISSDGEWLITGTADGSYNTLYLDGGEIFFYQWTGSTYTLRQRMKVSSFCDYGSMGGSMPDGASPIVMNGNGTRAVVPISYQHEYQKGREKLWVLERTGTTWAAAKYFTLADPAPWTDTGTLVTSGGLDYMALHHTSIYKRQNPTQYADIEGWTFSLGERPSSMNKAGDIIVTCTNLLNYRHYQQPGAIVWRL